MDTPRRFAISVTGAPALAAALADGLADAIRERGLRVEALEEPSAAALEEAFGRADAVVFLDVARSLADAARRAAGGELLEVALGQEPLAGALAGALAALEARGLVGPAPVADEDDEVRERLRGLGYI